MIIFKKSKDLQNFLATRAGKNEKTGFVPTMGALHNGHVSLIKASKENGDFTLCSIFVNPVQFNDPKDYEKYPITIENDIRMLEESGCDVLFLPAVSEVYPDGARQDKQYDLGYLETILEGRYRPGHFQAVCMVMDKLLNIISTDNLYLGRKDYQQCMVIKKLVALRGEEEKINVNICPTLREADGLAMSSRNMRLTEAERKKAVTIYKALEWLKTNLKKGELQRTKIKAGNLLDERGFKTDYVEIADAETLEIAHSWDGKTQVVGLIASFLNGVRLIDNTLLND